MKNYLITRQIHAFFLWEKLGFPGLTLGRRGWIFLQFGYGKIIWRIYFWQWVEYFDDGILSPDKIPSTPTISTNAAGFRWLEYL